jgi:PAS domain S-box-containing protein
MKRLRRSAGLRSEAATVGNRSKSTYRRLVDIRTKLVFAFAAVTIGSMLVFGYFLNGIADRMISDSMTDQLDSLAGSATDAIESIIEGWEERVQLIASRTQLRASLRDLDDDSRASDSVRIRTILSDAASSTRSVAAAAVYDTRGQQVATAGDAEEEVPSILPPRSTSALDEEPHYLGVFPSGEAYPRVGYSIPLLIDDSRVGYLYVLLNGHRLIDLTSDSTGLGDSGEVLVVVDGPEGPRTLHPVRHPAKGFEANEPILITGPDDPARIALAGKEGIHTEGLRDYRGHEVWAATRFLPETTGWGLVVKYDADERRAGIEEFTGEMVGLALSLTGIGLLVALVLAFRFAGPIHALAETANKIREGDLSARAPVKREDEIGLLARTFNQTADELQARMTELHEYKKFFDVSLDLLCIAATDGYFKLTNPAFTKLLGWTEEQLLSRPFIDLVHPDDVEATANEIRKLSEGMPTISFVNRFRAADGSWKYLKWNSYPETESGLLYAIARETRPPAG